MPSNSILLTFRKQQLLDIARAYEIPIKDEKADKTTIFFQMVAYEQQGVFMKPPKHLWYFERAKLTSDQMKQAKSNNGWYEDDQKQPAFCRILAWDGPAADPVPEKPTIEERKEAFIAKQKANASKSPMAGLRKRAKELNINSFGKSGEQLKREIAEAEGAMQKPEVAA